MFLLSIATVNCVEYSLLATVTVKPIYILTLDIEVISRQVLPSSTINTLLKLNKTGRSGKITVDLKYEIILSNKKTVILTTADVNQIDVDDYVERNVYVNVPDIKQGKYILKVTASHRQAVSSSDFDDFWVRKKIVMMSMNLFEPLAWIFQFLNRR